MLGARFIAKKNPVWDENCLRITLKQQDTLIQCTNLLLSNYNLLKIGSATARVVQIFGPHLIEFDGSLISPPEEKIEIDLKASTINLTQRDSVASTRVSPRNYKPL